jgi:AmmeMemoRadiSam system protein B
MLDPSQLTQPKLRAVEAHPVEHQGQQMILLRDPLRLGSEQIAIPRPLGLLLTLMDGTRDEAALEAALQVRAGVRLAPGLLSRLVADLDSAYLLENERFVQAKREALRSYREAPYRPLTLDGASFAPGSDLVSAQLQAYVDALPPARPLDTAQPIRGLISPHIDYQRGGPVYAEVWRAATEAACDAELVIVLGTDHQGSAGTVTLTRQSYATPFGVLPTDTEVVDALVEVLGEDAAFGEELNHRGEHSIELAAVWLHFVRGGKSVSLLPILCGHFGGFVEGSADPADHEPFTASLEVLRQVVASQRVLVVAAADLAHVGPAFGDPYGLDFVAKAQLRNADERLLETVCAGDAAAFFENLKAEGDRRHVCGLPPIYLTLQLLGEASGEPAGYDICPADQHGMSFVSVAGVILH